MIPSLFVPDLKETASTVRLSIEQSRHLNRVLRLAPGDKVHLLDGKGRRWEARIEPGGPGVTVRVGLETPVLSESPLRIMLIQGLPKGDRMDLIVEKATELGVWAIHPVVTERSQVRATGRTDRWRRIAESAASQSGRAFIPEIFEPEPLEVCLASKHQAGIVFWEEEEASEGQPDLPGQEISVLVGPEGGLTAREVDAACQSGFIRASLGPRILRTETAAIVATGLVQFLYGDLGGRKRPRSVPSPRLPDERQ